MSKFVPDQGTLFYVSVKPFNVDVESLEGNVTTRLVVDTSYSEDIFKCLAVDDCAIVAMKVINVSSYDKKKIFKITRHDFNPVGPDVARELGLAENIQNKQ